MKENYKEIRKITEKLYPPAGAERIAKQIYEADEAIEKAVAGVKPGQSCIDAVNAGIDAELLSQKRARRWRIPAAAAACIAFIATAAVTSYFLGGGEVKEQTPAETVVKAAANDTPQMQWDDGGRTDDLELQLETIEYSFEYNEAGSEDDLMLVEIENQLQQLQDVFWKG